MAKLPPALADSLLTWTEAESGQEVPSTGKSEEELRVYTVSAAADATVVQTA